jgi:site-specific DNA recombinase
MKAIAYTRISTADQSEYSLESQERTIREYCARNGLQLVTIFKDDGQSSYTFDRPDFKALEAFIRKNKGITHLVILDLDRFSRNLAEALMKIQELQTKFGIRVLSTSDNFDTDFADPSNFMIRAFKLMMAESELHNIRKRTKAGMVQAALNGRWAHTAPYGYVNRRDMDNKPILEQDPHKAEIVRMIFREYLASGNLRGVLLSAREMGYKQRSKSAIQRILTNPAYCGLVPVPAHKGRKKPFAPGLHAPIISEQDFWLVQEKFVGKKKRVNSKEDVYLRGGLRCWCGRLVTAGNSRNRHGKTYWYYLCSEHREGFSARNLHLQFQELLETLSMPLAYIDQLREKLVKEMRTKLGNQVEERERVEKELKRHQLQIKSVERRFLMMGNASEETFNEVMAEMKADEVRMQRQLAATGNDAPIYFERLNIFLDRLSNLWKLSKIWPPKSRYSSLMQGSISHFTIAKEAIEPLAFIQRSLITYR